jgi:hypothetical protein
MFPEGQNVASNLRSTGLKSANDGDVEPLQPLINLLGAWYVCGRMGLTMMVFGRLDAAQIATSVGRRYFNIFTRLSQQLMKGRLFFFCEHLARRGRYVFLPWRLECCSLS